jgi:hypothetical protein
MKQIFLACLLPALALFCAPNVFAGLKYESTSLALKAKPEEDELAAVYKFKNEGKEAVKVLQVETSCGCLKAEADKKSYEPGEIGVINAVFKLSKFTGAQSKSITVVSNDKSNSRQKLNVSVDIPKVVEITPALLEWKVGEEAKTKSFRIKIPHVDPIKILSVKPSRDTFSYEMKTIEEGRDYEILLTPMATDTPMLGVLRIETDCAIEKHKRQMAFFSIAKPRPVPAQKPAVETTSAEKK